MEAKWSKNATSVVVLVTCTKLRSNGLLFMLKIKCTKVPFRLHIFQFQLHKKGTTAHYFKACHKLQSMIIKLVLIRLLRLQTCHCIKTAERTVMLSSPHDSLFILVLCICSVYIKIFPKFRRGHPLWGR